MSEPLTVEIEGRTYVESGRAAHNQDGTIVFTVDFRPARLTLDDYTRIAYETRRESFMPPWDRANRETRVAWRAGIAAAFAAAGHPLPEGDAT